MQQNDCGTATPTGWRCSTADRMLCIRGKQKKAGRKFTFSPALFHVFIVPVDTLCSSFSVSRGKEYGRCLLLCSRGWVQGESPCRGVQGPRRSLLRSPKRSALNHFCTLSFRMNHSVSNRQKSALDCPYSAAVCQGICLLSCAWPERGGEAYRQPKIIPEQAGSTDFAGGDPGGGTPAANASG